MDEEIYKDVNGYEGLYQVSNLGRVKSFYSGKERILKPGKHTRGYLLIILRKNKKPKPYRISRLVASTFIGDLDNKVVDHIDHDVTNNRVDNLRICSQAQNTYNRIKRKNTSSKFKGVYWYKSRRRWRGIIGFNSKAMHIGYYNTELEGAKAYDKKALELYGDFALTNKIMKLY